MQYGLNSRPALQTNLQKRLMGNFGYPPPLFSKDGNMEDIFQFLIACLNLKMNGLLYGIFLKKTFQILISFQRIHFFTLLRI